MRQRRRRVPSPEELAESLKEYRATAALIEADVQAFLDPDWIVTFTYQDGTWWFDIGELGDGSFAGSPIEYAVYLQEYLSQSPRWPRCREHGTPLSIQAHGRTSIAWSCRGGSRSHYAVAGDLASIADPMS